MAQLENFKDMTGTMPPDQVNAQNISAILDEMNRGFDPTVIPRRSILASSLRVIDYTIGAAKMHAGATLAAGGFASLVINYSNTGQTVSQVGQTFLPVFYVDLFVDPPNTANLYGNSGAYIYPNGANVTTAMANLTFCWYLRNSTPGDSTSLVSYVLEIRNSDSAAHSYWIASSMLLPVDGNINPGGSSLLLP